MYFIITLILTGTKEKSKQRKKTLRISEIPLTACTECSHGITAIQCFLQTGKSKKIRNLVDRETKDLMIITKNLETFQSRDNGWMYNFSRVKQNNSIKSHVKQLCRIRQTAIFCFLIILWILLIVSCNCHTQDYTKARKNPFGQTVRDKRWGFFAGVFWQCWGFFNCWSVSPALVCVL